jgi:glycosyltransferase involved in cell wall biosynthesis
MTPDLHPFGVTGVCFSPSLYDPFGWSFLNLMKIAQLITDNREPDRKYDCEVPYFGTATSALLQGFANRSDVEVHVVSCTQRPMKSPEKLTGNIFFHSLLVPKLGWLRTGYQGCVRAARRKLREIRPDIVHGQGSERDQNISAVFSGFPNVITIHGNMRLVAKVQRARPFTFQWLAARLEEFTVPRAGGVVCITNHTRQAVGSLARKTWVVPNAVDSSFFDVERAPSPVPRVLCIATVYPLKNQNALIRAVDSLHPDGKFELVFLGVADRKNDYAREFFSLVETRPWCRYAGFADRNALRQYIASAVGLVLPSLEENCPMSILEAMAVGVPVAAAQVGGVPDLVRQGETGLLFDPLDGEDMANAMERLLGAGSQSLAALAQAEARKRFHPDIIAERHLEIYREVLASPR